MRVKAANKLHNIPIKSALHAFTKQVQLKADQVVRSRKIVTLMQNFVACRLLTQRYDKAQKTQALPPLAVHAAQSSNPVHVFCSETYQTPGPGLLPA